MIPMDYKIKNNRIYVHVDYEQRGLAKDIKGYWWHPTDKVWSFPLTSASVTNLNDLFDLGIMQFKKEKAEIESQKRCNITAHAIDDVIKPLEHQRIAIDMMIEQKQMALFLEMGLGKTRCVIGWYLIAKTENWIDGMLVICPKSVVSSWIEELDKLGFTEADYVILDGSRHARANKMDTKKINILNYAGVQVLEEYLFKFNHERIAVVLDESSKIKNPQAKRSKLIVKNFPYCIYKFALSGTPITQNPIDIYCQLKFLNPDFLPFNSWYSFRNTYCLLGGYMNYQIVGYKNLPELEAHINKHAYILKKKDCTHLDLPEKIYETLVLDMNAEMKAQYKEMKTNLMLEISEDNKITAPIILVKLLRLSQILSGAFLKDQKDNIKLNEVVTIIKEFSGEQKVIVWCRFRESIKLLSKAFDTNKITYVTFYGETKDRQETIERFRNTDVKVFIGQLQTGGMGLNLQCASMTIYFENDFSLQNRLQSEDRCHRVGQKNNVTYVDLIYKGTIDEQIKQAINDKQEIANKLIKSFKGGMQ